MGRLAGKGGVLSPGRLTKETVGRVDVGPVVRVTAKAPIPAAKGRLTIKANMSAFCIAENRLEKKSGNQTRRPVIHYFIRVGHMSTQPNFRRSGIGSTWIRVVFACAALVALLAARSISPRFPTALDGHSSISIDSHHDQRPRFDDSGSKWIAPAEIASLFPASAESTHLTPASRRFSTLYTIGSHYNRPPPVVYAVSLSSQ
jgi:hypothetical protein